MRARRACLWTLATIVIIVLDRVLKALVLALPTGSAYGPSWAEFSLFRNNGIAFSLPLSGWLYWILALPILLAVGLAFLRALRRGAVCQTVAFGAVLLGALSNFFDRAVYGYVIDYLIFFGLSAVNLADGLIVAGIAAAILSGRAGRNN